MNFYYPICLDLSGKNVLVVGAGEIAFDKIRSLLFTHAVIYVVSDQVISSIQKLSRINKIILIQRAFVLSDLYEKYLVIAATNDSKLQYLISEQCRLNHILVNIVDVREYCSFIIPSIVRKGNVLFTISTGGTSPALAKFLRKKIEKLFGYEVHNLSCVMQKIRQRFSSAPLTLKRKIFDNLLSSNILKTAKELKSIQKLQEYIDRILKK